MTLSSPDAGASTPTKYSQWDSSWPEFVKSEIRKELLDFWERRFGIPPALFSPYDMAASSRVTYLIRKSPHIPALGSLRIVRAGLPFMRNTGIHRKPTTEAVQLFGHMATRNVISLDMKTLKKICIEEEIRLSIDSDSGFVFIREEESLWGCGLFLRPDRLLCRLPKNMKKLLAEL